MDLRSRLRCSASSTSIQVLIEVSSRSEVFRPRDFLILRRIRKAMTQEETVVTISVVTRTNSLIDTSPPLAVKRAFSASYGFSLLAHSSSGFDFGNVGGGQRNLASGGAHIHGDGANLLGSSFCLFE